jgi:hypothetical protein
VRAAARLGYWLKKAAEGQDIGFTIPGHVVALRPVEIYSDDYALREYGATPKELDRFVAKAKAEIRKDEKQAGLNGSPASCDRHRSDSPLSPGSGAVQP